MTTTKTELEACNVEIASNDPIHNCEVDKQDKSIKYKLIDHISHFSGLAVAQLYLFVAAVTLYEIVMRYVFNAPTEWAFEIVMVLCATAWTLSSGHVTLHRRHIGITVIHNIASKKNQKRLDIFAMIIAVIALYLLLADATTRAYHAISEIERSGSAFNSPMPLVLKSLLVLGGFLYLAQLLMNLYRDVDSKFWKIVVRLVSIYMVFYFTMTLMSVIMGEQSVFGTISLFFTNVGQILDPSAALDMRSYGLGIISFIMVLLLIGLMMTGMPLGIVTLFVSVLMAICFFGPKGLFLVSTNTVGLLEHYTLVAIPLFVLMASILERSGVAEDLFDAMSIFSGNLRGGVAVQTVIVSVILAAMSGVMGGEIVMLGLVALPQLFRLGYDRKLSIGLIVSSGALATLIPPSIIMIVYGLSAEVSIGDLFMAGVVPGIMLALFYTAYVLVRVNLNHDLAPTAKEVAEKRGNETHLSKSKMSAVVLCIILVFSVMGTIYAGIASVTEAAAVGCVGAMIVAIVRNEFSWSLLQEALTGTMSTVGTIIWLVLGAVSFVGIFNLVGGGDFMRSLFLNLGLSPIGIILAMMGILVILGTFMEWIAIVLITVPVFAPVVVTLAPELGLTVDEAKIWFGILFVINIQIYYLSPPFGPACFWLKSVAPDDVSLQEIFMSVIPFIILQIIGLVLVLLMPQIALWLPSVLG